MSQSNNPPIGGDDVSALIVDIGSHSTRVGYGQEDTPKQFWNSCAGKYVGETDDRSSSSLAFPLSFFERQDSLEVKPCIFSNGGQYDMDVDVFETIVRYTVEGKSDNLEVREVSPGARGGLGVLLADHPVLLSEPSRHSVSVREKMAQSLFENFGVPALYVAKRALLSAFASGRANALVVDIGSSGMTACPVFEGYCLEKNLMECPVGGDLLDAHLSACLEEKGHQIHPFFAHEKIVKGAKVAGIRDVDISQVHPSYIQCGLQEVIRTMRESVCKVICEQAREEWDSKSQAGCRLQSPGSTSFYELPDGTQVDTHQLSYSVGEILFQPHLIKGISLAALGNFRGLPRAIVDCIHSCDVDLRRDLLGAILLTGGTSLMPGQFDESKLVQSNLAVFFSARASTYKTRVQENSENVCVSVMCMCPHDSGLAERLSNTMQNDTTLIGRASKLRLIVPTASVERRFSCWLGGSILASLGTFQQHWISKQEYFEYGASILERRCH